MKRYPFRIIKDGRSHCGTLAGINLPMNMLRRDMHLLGDMGVKLFEYT